MNDSHIECAHCGESFYYDLTSCPNCGISVYPEEGELEEVILEETIYSEFVGGILAVFLGWFVSGVIGVLIYIAPLWLFGEQAYHMPLLILRFGSLPIGSYVGSFTAVAMTKRSPLLYGTLVGVLSFSYAVLFASYERDLAVQPLITTGMLVWWGVILIAGVAGALTNARFSERAVIEQLFSLPDSEDELYEQLYIKVGYDYARVERLIDLERERFPHASRYYLIKSAISQWERDSG